MLLISSALRKHVPTSFAIVSFRSSGMADFQLLLLIEWDLAALADSLALAAHLSVVSGQSFTLSSYILTTIVSEADNNFCSSCSVHFQAEATIPFASTYPCHHVYIKKLLKIAYQQHIDRSLEWYRPLRQVPPGYRASACNRHNPESAPRQFRLRQGRRHDFFHIRAPGQA